MDRKTCGNPPECLTAQGTSPEAHVFTHFVHRDGFSALEQIVRHFMAFSPEDPSPVPGKQETTPTGVDNVGIRTAPCDAMLMNRQPLSMSLAIPITATLCA